MNENVRACMCVYIYIYQVFNFMIYTYYMIFDRPFPLLFGEIWLTERDILVRSVANSSIGFALYSVENFLIVLLRGEKVVCDRDRRW